jgi:phosphoribosylanthranilate isomerase
LKKDTLRFGGNEQAHSLFYDCFAVRRLIVQVYEIQTPLEAEGLIELDVDHIGSVILSEEQWMLPRLKDTVQVIKSTTAKSSLIPLFNNPDSVLRTLEYYQPDIVHFCEALAGEGGFWDFVDNLIGLQQDVKKHFPQIKIMRSIPIAPSGADDKIPTLEYARRFEPVSDFFLTDTLLVKPAGIPDGRQPVQGFVGITGKTCNWETAARLVDASGIPVILAGGISPQNVIDGILRVKPAGIDSCTWTNAQDKSGGPIRFKKDLGKVRQLVAHVRQAEKLLQSRLSIQL